MAAPLARAIAAATARLPASPGAAYLERRGILLDIAQRLRIGWGTVGALAGRVVFPLCDPDGEPTSAIGRAITDQARPKYKALAADAGYSKTLFNGGAIAQAKRSGHPLIVVEGPMDTAACVAAGIPLTVAIGSTTYRYPEHFAGLSTVILALDNDAAGQAARQALWLALTARGIEVLLLPASALNGCKDLGEYWQRHRTMPMQLRARAMGPYMRDVPRTVAATIAGPPDRVHDCPLDAPPELLLRQTVAVACPPALPEHLPPHLRADAEALVAELIAGGPSTIAELHTELEQNTALAPDDRTATLWAIHAATAGGCLLDRDGEDAHHRRPR